MNVQGRLDNLIKDLDADATAPMASESRVERLRLQIRSLAQIVKYTATITAAKTESEKSGG